MKFHFALYKQNSVLHLHFIQNVMYGAIHNDSLKMLLWTQ